MKSSRVEKIEALLRQRQVDVQLILDRVHDMHNVAAVVRTCDAVGIPEVDVVFDRIANRRKLRVGKMTSSGARKWVRVYAHASSDTALGRLTWSEGRQVIAAAHHPAAVSLYDIDLTIPTAIIMGNEHDGVREDLLAQADHVVAIPQHGIVESLNISVACAIILYEMLRQREKAGLYDPVALTSRHEMLRTRYLAEHNKSVHGYARVYRGEEE